MKEAITMRLLCQGKNRAIAVIITLAAVILFASCEQPAGNPQNTGGGAGTINSAADLAKIGTDSEYPLDADYTLSANITLNNWTPIGDYTAEFTGTFDGGNRTITITGTGGVFAYTKGAAIRNLKVAGTITAESEDGEAVMVGGIAGNVVQTLIENCASSVNITATGHGHNSTAGGIAGNMRDNSTVRSCAAGGSITLNTGADEGLMIYAGGLVGYAGDGSSDGSAVSGCVISTSSWTGGTVSVQGAYPYAGGIVGYNYAGSIVSECYSIGTVAATGENLPYAGGVAGYNSRSAIVKDSYSAATVNASASSKQALAGGVTAVTAAGAVTQRCYATGQVTVRINGSGAADVGGSIGVPAAANAGGISGSMYILIPVVEYCAALNTGVSGIDTGSGGVLEVYRIAGKVEGTLTNNIANPNMTVSGGTVGGKGADKQDGADTASAKPAQSAFAALGWDFAAVWKWDAIKGCPVLQWQQ
jgi:hypothetical protein